MYSSSEDCSTFPKPAIFQGLIAPNLGPGLDPDLSSRIPKYRTDPIKTFLETASFDNWIQKTIQKERKCLCHKIVPGRQLIAPNMCCLNTPYNDGLKGLLFHGSPGFKIIKKVLSGLI